MAKLNKLLLVRKASARSTLLDRMNVSRFVEGEPLNISPKTWPDEAGISHYGYVLKDISVKELNQLQDWISNNDPEAVTVQDYNVEADNPLESALAYVGLRINEAAE